MLSLANSENNRKEVKEMNEMKEELLELLKKLGGIPKAADEEQEFGTKLFKSVVPRIGQEPICDWLHCEEWEDALVPVRLPKGMTDELKQMDEAKEEAQLNECRECKTKADCPMIKRNPSEILLTYLMKYAISGALAAIISRRHR